MTVYLHKSKKIHQLNVKKLSFISKRGEIHSYLNYHNYLAALVLPSTLLEDR